MGRPRTMGVRGRGSYDCERCGRPWCRSNICSQCRRAERRGEEKAPHSLPYLLYREAKLREAMGRIRPVLVALGQLPQRQLPTCSCGIDTSLSSCELKKNGWTKDENGSWTCPICNRRGNPGV